MSVNVKPLADRVLVEPLPAEKQNRFGYYHPRHRKREAHEGHCYGCRPGKADEPMSVKVGDVVLYGKYAGTELTVDGKDYLIMRESDIFAII